MHLAEDEALVKAIVEGTMETGTGIALVRNHLGTDLAHRTGTLLLEAMAYCR